MSEYNYIEPISMSELIMVLTPKIFLYNYMHNAHLLFSLLLRCRTRSRKNHNLNPKLYNHKTVLLKGFDYIYITLTISIIRTSLVKFWNHKYNFSFTIFS